MVQLMVIWASFQQVEDVPTEACPWVRRGGRRGMTCSLSLLFPGMQQQGASPTGPMWQQQVRLPHAKPFLMAN